MYSSCREPRFRQDYLRLTISLPRCNAGRNGTLRNSGRTSRSREEKPSVLRLGHRWNGEERKVAIHRCQRFEKSWSRKQPSVTVWRVPNGCFRLYRTAEDHEQSCGGRECPTHRLGPRYFSDAPLRRGTEKAEGHCRLFRRSCGFRLYITDNQRTEDITHGSTIPARGIPLSRSRPSPHSLSRRKCCQGGPDREDARNFSRHTNPPIPVWGHGNRSLPERQGILEIATVWVSSSRR